MEIKKVAEQDKNDATFSHLYKNISPTDTLEEPKSAFGNEQVNKKEAALSSRTLFTFRSVCLSDINYRTGTCLSKHYETHREKAFNLKVILKQQIDLRSR